MNMLNEPVVLLNRWIYKQLVNMALTDPHNEICGLVGGRFLNTEEAIGLGFSIANKDSIIANITEAYQIPNLAGKRNVNGVHFNSAEAGFIADPKIYNDTYNRILSSGKHVVGCYHSHPYWSGYPSSIDLANASDEYFWLIYSGKYDILQASYYNAKDKLFIESRLIIGNINDAD